MPTNFYMYFVVALVPLVLGFIYYNPKVLGTAWMKACGFTEEDLKGGNMAMTFILSYIFAVMLAFILGSLVIHQSGVYSMLMPGVMESGSAEQTVFNDLMANYGGAFRTFSHGAAHGFFLSLFLVFPIFATNSMFEKKGWKYVWINMGYWTICLIIMGGILCQTLQYAPAS